MDEDPLFARADAAIREARRLRAEADQHLADTVRAYETVFNVTLSLTNEVGRTASEVADAIGTGEQHVLPSPTIPVMPPSARPPRRPGRQASPDSPASGRSFDRRRRG